MSLRGKLRQVGTYSRRPIVDLPIVHVAIELDEAELGAGQVTLTRRWPHHFECLDLQHPAAHRLD